MKILHLSTSTSGGAANIAASLSRIQQKFGHESQVMSRDLNLSSAKKLQSKFSTLVGFTNATPEYAQLTHFSFQGIELQSIWTYNPSVVFIHNWFNLLREKDIVAISNRIPTIFVAHDGRLATGGCHVTLDCTRYLSQCKSCPAAKVDLLSAMAKRSIDSNINEMGQYGVISPSNWLMTNLRETPIIRKAKITRVIPNPSSLVAQSAYAAKKASTLNFEILFVAASLESKYKGLELLVAALSSLDVRTINNRPIDVKIVGNGRILPLPELPPNIRVFFQGGKSSSEVQELMIEADLLMVPSFSENYPGVISEAQILGCTVAASRVGGIPEMIEDGLTGFLFEPTEAGCADAIVRAINSPVRDVMNERARASAKARHDEGKINSEYEYVIEQLVNP